MGRQTLGVPGIAGSSVYEAKNFKALQIYKYRILYKTFDDIYTKMYRIGCRYNTTKNISEQCR